MALIRKAACKRDFGQRQVGPGQELLCTPHAALHKKFVRRQTLRLFERAGEVIHRFPRDTGERLKADILLQVCLDIFAHAS